MNQKVNVVTSLFESKFFVFFVYSFKTVAAAHEENNINDSNDDNIEKDTNPQLILSKTNNSSKLKKSKKFENTLNLAVMKERIIIKMTITMKTMMIKLQLKSQIRKRKIVDIFNSSKTSIIINDESITTFAKR